jgi:hypothetical protein
MWVATKEVGVWKWKNEHETQQRSNENLYENIHEGMIARCYG